MKFFAQIWCKLSAYACSGIRLITPKPFRFNQANKRKIIMRINLTFTILFTAFLQISLAADAQKVTFSKGNASLEEVLKAIHKQTDYNFLYTDEMMEETEPVNVQFKNTSLQEALQQCFSGQPLTYSVDKKTVVIRRKPQLIKLELPPVIITGKVTDDVGPLPGVSVKLKGSSTGTTTDTEGRYTINVPDGIGTLVFSFIGFTMQEIVINGRKTIDVKLSAQSSALDEVVVVGYGTQKKESLTGAISQIKSAEILTTKSTNLVSSLEGKVSGLQIRQQTGEPGQFTSMLSIRGFGSPLIVIDGVARDGVSDFERLNPQDIESISVLKDASAAIYGINADNGVIIVTTKKGSKGKPKILYSGFYSLTSPTILQKSVNAYTSMLLQNEMDANSGKPKTFTDEALLERYHLGTEEGYQDYNWVGNTLKQITPQQQHNLSVRGGNDNITYFTSLGWVENNGILKSNIEQYQRYNFRSNLSVKITKNLAYNIGFSGRYDKNKGPQGSFFWLMKPIMTADRRFSPYTIANPNHLTNIPGNSNPYALMNEDVSGYDKWENSQYQTNMDLTYSAPFMEGLKFKLLGAYDANVRNAANLKKVYYQYDYYTDSPTAPTGKATYLNDNTLFSRKNLQTQLSYNKTFENTHQLDATLVYEIKSTTQNFLMGQRQWDNLFTNDILNQADLTNLSNSGNRIETAFSSFLGRFNYAFKSKYLVEFAFRRDGSYRYAPSKRWGFFPVISAGWIMSKESFIKDNLPAISFLKLRGSYGLIGADPENTAPFQYVGGYTVGGIDRGYVFNSGTLTRGMIPPGVVNDNLTWIKTKTSDIGVDLDLWQGKLGITADLFQKDRTGLLGYRQISIPNTFGATFPQENLNSDRIKGLDLMVSHKSVIGDFSYELKGNLTYARMQKIYTERAPYGNSWERWHDVNANNRLVGALWGFKYDGVYTNILQYQTAPLYNGYWGSSGANSMNLPGTLKIIDTNGDGKINNDDMVPLLWNGQNNPPLHYGLTIDAAWKGIDFNILFQGSALFTVTYANSDMWGYGTYPQITDKFLDRWHTSNPNADPFDPATKWVPGYYPALKLGPKVGTPDEFATDMWNMNAAYLRIKSVELGYNLPKYVCNKLHIDNIRMYVNTFNLYTFARKDVKMFDPERFEGQYNADLTYPLMKSYTIGLNINF